MKFDTNISIEYGICTCTLSIYYILYSVPTVPLSMGPIKKISMVGKQLFINVNLILLRINHENYKQVARRR